MLRLPPSVLPCVRHFLPYGTEGTGRVFLPWIGCLAPVHKAIMNGWSLLRCSGGTSNMSWIIRWYVCPMDGLFKNMWAHEMGMSRPHAQMSASLSCSWVWVICA
jgi:hypothetical protein